jgi:hypothetical protein
MGRLRDAWHALRGYAAAQDSRASAWAPSGGSATAEVGMAAATVARRAHDVVRNDPYATQPHRPYDFRPPPEPRRARRIIEPWRLAMVDKLDNPDAKARCARRKQTVEPVFGFIKAALGFTRFHLRGIANVTSEWPLIALAYNCRRLHRLRQA